MCFSYGFFCIFILKILLHFFGIFSHISFEIETANVKTYAFTQIVNFFLWLLFFVFTQLIIKFNSLNVCVFL